MYVLHIQAWYAAFGARDMVEQSCKDFPNKVEVCDLLLFVCKIMFVTNFINICLLMLIFVYSVCLLIIVY